MIRIALFSSIPEETQCIRRVLTAYSVKNSWADCQVNIFPDSARFGELSEAVDVLISDASCAEAINVMKEQKAQNPPMLIFPIAGPEVPPTSYVCPEIMPCGLFWRPVDQRSAQPVVEQMMAKLHDQAIPRSQSCFRISGKQKIQDVPFASILFFEAREKKLVLRMQSKELMFSGTLSQLEEELPSDFIRCHKSFLVNRQHIMSVDRTNGIIILDNRMEIPVSRGYKKAFLEEFHVDA